MAHRFVPDAGDIVWLEFSPQAGHEQAGHRPALVLSAASYNSKTGTMVCCPMTTQIKGYPFEVALSGDGATGVALADQVKSFDWQTRQAERKGKATAAEMVEIKSKIKSLLKLA